MDIIGHLLKNSGRLYMSTLHLFFNDSLDSLETSLQTAPPFTTFRDPGPTPSQEDVLGLQISMPWDDFPPRRQPPKWPGVGASFTGPQTSTTCSWWLKQPVWKKYDIKVKLDPSSPNN